MHARRHTPGKTERHDLSLHLTLTRELVGNFKLFMFIYSYPDEFESTRIIGERQFKKAVELFDKASEQLKGKVDYRHAYLNFSSLEVSLPKVGGGQEVVKTCPAAMGFSFAAGTTDGPGAFDFNQGDDKVRNCWYMFDPSLYNAPVEAPTLGIDYFFGYFYRGMHSGGW